VPAAPDEEFAQLLDDHIEHLRHRGVAETVIAELAADLRRLAG
jgi:hypothetical protein